MEYAFEERIGDPDLFTGRKKELEHFINWIRKIKKRLSKSTAIIARRKMGKSALMERLFNITFEMNDNIVPVYYEVKETKMWIVDFCIEFFLNFLYQYMAFKTRKPEYLKPLSKNNLTIAKELARKEGMDDLAALVENVEYLVRNDRIDNLWEAVREVPHTIAFRHKVFILQMIDEFQFLTREIYWDKEKTNLAHNMSGGYLSTAESKIAPLLVSGSWVGWIMDQLMNLLPSRFLYYFLGTLPEDEAVEMVFRYSQSQGFPVTEEIAFLIVQLTEGSPFYISSIFNSLCPVKDLTTVDGLLEVLEFETLNSQGGIKGTWLEYMGAAFQKINDRHAKNIVLYLCKNKHREVTRKELKEDLNLDMSDSDLEKKMHALVKADVIQNGSSNFRYKAINDNVFDKVFRGIFQEEIDEFQPGQISTEYKTAFEELQEKYRRLQGKLNYTKGYFAEYLIIDQLRYHGSEKNDLLKSITRNLPADFNFVEYSSVWSYRASVIDSTSFAVDIFARPVSPGDYSIIGEVKNRDTKKFSADEVHAFIKKMEDLKAIEKLSKAVGFIFSRKGFTSGAEALCNRKGIATTSDERWLDI